MVMPRRETKPWDLRGVALFVMQTGNEVVWKPQGPRAVLIALLTLMVPCLVVNVVHKGLHKTLPVDVVFVYYGAMVVATVWLIYSFRKAVCRYCSRRYNRQWLTFPPARAVAVLVCVAQ